jgi:hypothetical protein
LQRGLLTTNHQGMPCIVPTLKAHHTLRMISQPINHFTLALIAPLGTDDYDVFSHVVSTP